MDSSTDAIYRRIDDGNMMKRRWCNLPNELLSQIANELGIIDLLRFRSVCKDWNSASGTASAETESVKGKQPWLLSYALDSDESILLSKSGKCYKLHTPELNGANCIASMDGWLLVMKHDSIFFFCPFSHAKIDLPKLPNTEFPNFLVVFLTPPTSQDCIVAVACQNENSLSDIVLYFLRRGDKAWNCESLKQSLCKKIVCAAFHEDEFMLFDDASHCFKFTPRKMKWNTYRIVPWSVDSDSNLKTLPIGTTLRYLDARERQILKEALKEDDVFIQICGTGFVADERSNWMTFIESSRQGSEISKHLKGVWIHPRLFYLADAYTW